MFQGAHTQSIASVVDSWLKAYLSWFPNCKKGKILSCFPKVIQTDLAATAFLPGLPAEVFRLMFSL